MPWDSRQVTLEVGAAQAALDSLLSIGGPRWPTQYKEVRVCAERRPLGGCMTDLAKYRPDGQAAVQAGPGV